MAAALAAALWVPSACTARDCGEERAGQVRCIANRSETCNADGTLTYVSCTAQGLFCSVEKGGCVTKDILNSTGGGTGEGGSGGASSGGGMSSGGMMGSGGSGG